MADLEKRNAELSNVAEVTLDWIENHKGEIMKQLESWSGNYEAGWTLEDLQQETLIMLSAGYSANQIIPKLNEPGE